MEIKEELIGIKVAKLAKERGLPQNDPRWFRKVRQSLLARWLREVHSIDVISYPSFMGKNMNYYYVIIKDRDFDNIIQGMTDNYSYEQAFEDGLKQALTLIKL